MTLGHSWRSRLPAIGFAGAAAAALGTAGLHNPAVARELATVSCALTTPCETYANSKSGAGVEGTSTGGSGVIGTSKFNAPKLFGDKPGVSGVDSSSTSTNNAGVHGSSTRGYGVIGTSASGIGVLGSTSGKTNAGVYGQTLNDSKVTGLGNAGVLGVDQETDGSSTNYGVGGFSTYGSAVYGNAAGTGAGLFGLSASGTGTVSVSAVTTGVFAQGSPSLVLSSIGMSAQDVLQGFDGSNALTSELDNAGNLHLSGKVFTAGSCSTGCAVTGTKNGAQVVAYHPREDSPTMESYGRGRLNGGSARVAIDPSFSQTIDAHAGYLVFLTPRGDNHGLYIASQSASGFVVREAQGGTSTLDFDYHLVAKPVDETRPRLPAYVPAPLHGDVARVAATKAIIARRFSQPLR